MTAPQGALRRQALLVIAVAALAGCDSAGKTDMELTQTVTQAAEKTAPGQVLALDQVAPGAWDRVLLIGPYTPEAQMKQALGGELAPALKRIQIDQRDDVNAVVFQQAGQTVAAVALPRRVADFPKSELMRPVPRAQARLLREASGVGYRWQPG